MTVPVQWTFFRAGGFDQVKLESGQDLANLEHLDQKLWVALACPTSGLELDPRTLSLIDADKDGRIRAPELIAAVKFACSYLKNPGDLLNRENQLPLSAINDETPEGKVLLASAKQVLVNLGKSDDIAISADDLTDATRIFANTPFNGDGVITKLSTDDGFIISVIDEVMLCVGSTLDRAGILGVNEALVTAFFDELRAYAEWFSQSQTDPEVLPLGREKTERAATAATAIGSKLDDYFARCRLAAADPRLSAVLNGKMEDYVEVTSHTLSASAIELAEFPLALVTPEGTLDLLGAVNPAYSTALRKLFDDAVVPLLGPKERLRESDWVELTTRLSAYRAWIASKQGPRVEKLGEPRITEILASRAHSTLTDLIAKDRQLEAEALSIENVERLVRYYRDLFLLCTNFVNFEDFYDGEEPAVFQCGVLYLDQRECHLCLRVQDPSKHAAMAGLAGAYLVYAECTRSASDEKMQIVAAFTAGDSENLMVGRNGLFYDRQGRDWDATITKIVENPISIRQAFWAPYKKFVRMIEEHVAKRAAAADTDANATLGAAASTATTLDKAAPSKEPQKIDVGSVAALGVAVGAIGAFVTALIGYATGILKLGILPTLAAIAGVICLISLPSVVLAYLTLRKRNLGPILDANGWAINARARINVSFGTKLTNTARLPTGSKRDARDRYVDKGPPWKRVVLLLLSLLLVYRWYEGQFDRFLPTRMQSTHVLGRFAPERPAASAPVPPNLR